MSIINAIRLTGTIPNQIYLERDKRMRESGLMDGLEALGVAVKGTPYNPTAKANVEQSFKQDRIHLDGNFKSYINNNPANRNDRAEEHIEFSLEDYRVEYNQFVKAWNHTKKIKFLKTRKTPVGIWNWWAKEKGWKPTRLPQTQIDQLPYLFAKKEELTVRGGMIRKTVLGEYMYYTGKCLIDVPEGKKVIIKRNIEDQESAQVFYHNKYIGNIEIFKALGYGYGEYSSQKHIEEIMRLRNLKKRKLKESKEDVAYLDAYINKVLHNKPDVTEDKILVPTGILKILPQLQEYDPAEITASEEAKEVSRILDTKFADDMSDQISEFLNQ
jgi:hypothetical protein